jgi:hypothetical protein
VEEDEEEELLEEEVSEEEAPGSLDDSTSGEASAPEGRSGGREEPAEGLTAPLSAITKVAKRRSEPATQRA